MSKIAKCKKAKKAKKAKKRQKGQKRQNMQKKDSINASIKKWNKMLIETKKPKMHKK